MNKETAKEFEGKKSVKICQMTSEMVEVTSHIHMQAFKGAMNTRLGISYARKLLDWFVCMDRAIALVAMVKAGTTEQIVGYAIGVPPSEGKNMDRNLFWVASWNACIRPWIFLSPQIRVAVKARFTAFWGPPDQRVKIDLPNPVMSLVGLAVVPNLQGQNIGKELLSAFEAEARDFHHVRSLKLSVYPENSAARRVYEKCGWSAWETSVPLGKAMYYFKNI